MSLTPTIADPITPNSDNADDPRARRAAANRQNAQKSTGPKTAEGKARSSRNAMTHGLSGKGAVLPDEVEAELQVRLKGWMESYKPKDQAEADLVELGAVTMTRLRHCWREESGARRRSIARAELAWDGDKGAEAARLARRIGSAPEIVAAELRRTLHGSLWLLDRWRSLAGRLESGKDWTEAHRALALDLLGVPALFRDDATAFDFPDLGPEESAAARADLVAGQIDELETEIEHNLASLDEGDRELRLDNLCFVTDPQVMRLARYERTLANRVTSIVATLRRGSTPADETKPTQAAPAERIEPPAPAATPLPDVRPTETEVSAQARPTPDPARPEPSPAFTKLELALAAWEELQSRKGSDAQPPRPTASPRANAEQGEQFPPSRHR